MNIKQLNEAISLSVKDNLKYADIDAKAVYDNCINADFGSHTFEEAKQFKDFVGITPETTEEELRGIRNTLVKYWADCVKEYNADDWGKSRSKEESDKNWKMGDQMQFFTTVIDMAIDNLPNELRIQESLNEEDKFRYDGNIKIKQVTKDEWEKTPNEYKLIKNGQKYILWLDKDTQATVLGRCEIIDESLHEAKLNKENSDYTLRYYADYSYDPVKNIYIDDMTLKEAIEFTINLDIPEDLNPNVSAYAILWDNKTDKKIAEKESTGHYWINPEYQKMLDESLHEEEREVKKIKFVTVDDWNRPIFKMMNNGKKYYLSDTDHLFDYGTSEKEIKDFYSNLEPLRNYITYHGQSIDTDPMGTQLKFDLEIE